ncbi:MAG: thiamine pyrophosphate-binding protein [archaeon]
MHGGQLISKILKKQGVKYLFTLCGGHISPILVGAKQEGIRVIDVRHEANAVFAADAVSRLSGTPGVAAVTAGPGLTNTITAVKNAHLAQSPLILFGGATATVLKGRGSLQDINQMKLMNPHVKWATTIKRYKDIAPKVEKAFRISQSGVPGPVFIECPIDLLYGEYTVREWYGNSSTNTLIGKIQQQYLEHHLNNMFASKEYTLEDKITAEYQQHSYADINDVQKLLKKSERPLLLIGSQAMLRTNAVEKLAEKVEKLNIPVYLSGMARGLLGPTQPLQLIHKRKDALKEADLVILAGVPCDFRLNYGQHIKSTYVSINISKPDLYKNKKPNKAILADPNQFLQELATYAQNNNPNWLQHLQKRDSKQSKKMSATKTKTKINPISLFKELNSQLSDNSIIIADGGDFVATGSYILQPRRPLSWIDPGVFGTLGVGAGFALGAKLCHPESEVWIIYGDGSSAYSLQEYDTFVRHKTPIISVIGNDACWSQIARDQIKALKDEVATNLKHSDYHLIAKAYGGDGKKVETIEDFIKTVKTAKAKAKKGTPYIINAIIGKTNFRQGSISM